MPSPEKSRILVLHLTKYSDHALILHTIDSAAGRRSFLVRDIKRGNAVAVFHPLSMLDAVSAESPKSTLAWLREWEPAVALPGIRGDQLKAAVENSLDMIAVAFEKQVDNLYRNTHLDITTDIQVLENMMAAEGLTDAPSPARAGR